MMRFSQGFKRYFANTSWSMAERFFSLTAGIAVGICVARYLGPERFGSLNFAASFVVLFLPLTHLGLDGIVVRELVRRPEEQDIVLGTAFWLRAAGALLAVIAACSFAWLMPPCNSGYELALVCWISAGIVFDAIGVFDLYNQANVKMKYSCVASVIACTVSSCMKIYLIFVSASVVWFAIADTIYKLARFLSLGLIHRMFSRVFGRLSFRATLAFEMLSDSWPLVLSSFAVIIYMKIDQVMLRYMTGPSGVGIYAAAVKISEMWYFFPVLLTQSLFPAIVSAQKRGDHECRSRIQRLLVLLTAFSYMVIAVVFLFGDEIVSLAFGAHYSGAAAILRIHIVALIFVCFGVVRGKWLLVENRTVLAFWCTFAGSVLNIAANLFLIPSYGGAGAAWATLVSYAVSGYFLDATVGSMRWMFVAKTRALLLMAGQYVSIRNG